MSYFPEGFKGSVYVKVVQLNAVCSGSTGKICMSVSELLTQQGIENYIFYADGSTAFPAAQRYMRRSEIKLQALRSRIMGNYGFNSAGATRRLLKKLDAICPDIVHLHNLHGHNCHLGMLFSYLKEKHIRVFWTFHDCWAFTGYCTHFVAEGCEQWKTGCKRCIQKKAYSWFCDRSPALYNKKKTLFTGLDLTVVTPSNWMAELVKESFLKGCPIKVIHNGIDLSVFRPCQSNFRKKHGLEGKRIVLGVASGWGYKKGLDSFIRLSEKLDDRYVCVLVGTDAQVDEQLPKNILSIHRTQNQQELAEIYSAADVFFNPTREDTYPTVNMEAIACGTPVVTYRTGGSSEIVCEGTGFAVAHNIDEAIEAIGQVMDRQPAMRKACLEAARSFDRDDRFRDYAALYTEEGGIL